MKRILLIAFGFAALAASGADPKGHVL